MVDGPGESEGAGRVRSGGRTDGRTHGRYFDHTPPNSFGTSHYFSPGSLLKGDVGPDSLKKIVVHG